MALMSSSSSPTFSAPSYSETDLSGGGFGLSYDAATATDARSETGARFLDNLQVVGNMPLLLRARPPGSTTD
jgi:hypothetical protein